MLDKADIVTVTLNPAVDRVIVVDDLRVGAHQIGRTVLRVPGGKGVNISHVLTALGVPSIATGFLGEESRADFLGLLSHPLITDRFISMPGRTRENITIADPAGNDTHIRDRGLAIDKIALKQMKEQLAEICSAEAVVVIFSGSIPPGMDENDFAEMVDICTRGGARVAVDTSGPALRAMKDKKLWMLAPNEEELAELLDREPPTRQGQLAAVKELTKRVEMIVLTCGSEGTYLTSRRLAMHGRVGLPPGTLRNTVGCGDVLLATFIGELWNDQPPAEALRSAVACAAASAACPATATFDDSLFKELKPQVNISDV